MCGINGIVNFNQQPVDKDLLIKMRDTLIHRGPDNSGVYIDGNVGFGHRRLSIIDLSENGKQPMFDKTGRYAITYNGEIYNYRELKSDLLQNGVEFLTETDTEVLLNLYVKYGPSMLDKLNGMFSFAIWDKLEKVLFLCRDRLGVKPLFYSIYNNSFFFASEQKAILAANVSNELNESLVDELLFFRFVAGENTIFKNIKKLLPGHYMILKADKINIFRWWNLSKKIQEKRNTKPEDPYEWFYNTFNSAVKARMISDVPVGVFLSGGLDSSSIVTSLALQNYKNLDTFTVGFNEDGYDESSIAANLSKKYCFNNHRITLTAPDLLLNLKEAAQLYDEPLVHQNDSHLLALSKYSKKFATVLLSGEGADEFMGGYVRYKPLRYSNFRRPLSLAFNILKLILTNPRYNKLARYFSITDTDELVLYNSSSLYPKDFEKMGIDSEYVSEYRYTIIGEAKEAYPNQLSRQAMYLDQHTHLTSLLERNDRMTMGASIECRVPFIDYRLVETISALPSNKLLKGKKGKNLLFESFKPVLTKEVVNFKKFGFGVPWEKYFTEENEFKNQLNEMRTNPIFQVGSLRFLNINEIIKNFQRGNSINNILIRQLYMIHVWAESKKIL